MTPDILDETIGIRDTMLEAAGRMPIPARTMFDRVRKQWGDIGDRRLWRASEWLVSTGQLQRTADGYIRGHAVVSEAEAETRMRVRLALQKRCYDCRRATRRDSDPSWFARYGGGYCYACYRARNLRRRRIA